MGYYVRHLAWKKSAPQWKIQFLSYKKSDASGSQAKKPKKEWDIPQHRWLALGFHRTMPLKDAQTRAKQLNAQALIKRQEERIRKLELDRMETRLRSAATIPDEFLTEFELRFIRARDSETERGLRKTSHARVVWRAAQKLIIAVRLDSSEWFYCLPEIYDYLYQQRYSPRYANSDLKMANLWGYFISRKLARPFLAIPNPRGYERQRIIEAYSLLHINRYQEIKAVSAALNLSLSHVERAVKVLKRLRLLDITQGKIKPKKSWMHLSRDSSVIRSHHQTWRLRAIEEFSRPQELNGFHYSGALTLSSEDAAVLRSELLSLDKVRHVVSKSDSKVAFALNVDFFPLT